jgi:hypothetical protein
MNRRKSASSLGFPSLVLLTIAAVIVSASGIGYVVMKNKQITARSQIAKAQKRMAAHEVSITLHQSDIEETLGYFSLIKQLEEQGSRLSEIELKNIERYQEPTAEDETQPSIAQK